MTSYLDSAKRTFQIERDSIELAASKLDHDFTRACEILMQAKGRIIVTGMGKSGHIGRKIAATFASTGSPAFFVHPGEAGHGDMGMFTQDDAVLAISNSGSTSEIMTLLPLIKRIRAPLVAMTGKPSSLLANAADVHLDVGIVEEACPLNLAPTSSTTNTLVMGDALAIALLEARGFTAEDFAFSHPSGALGRKLLLKVSDIMHGGKELPQVNQNTPLKLALVEMTAKGLGITAVTDAQDNLLGVFTDGDLRRVIDQGIDLRSVSVGEVMNIAPRTIVENRLAAEALGYMEEHKITALLVTNSQGAAVGVLHMHDILRANVV